MERVESPPKDAHRSLWYLSAAYCAYLKLKRLPTRTKPFEIGLDGYPKVMTGERFCRGRVNRNDICGKDMGHRNNLLPHVEAQHGASRHNRKRLERKPEILEAADAFYRDLMKDLPYPGKAFEDADRSHAIYDGDNRRSNAPSLSVTDTELAIDGTDADIKPDSADGSVIPTDRFDSTDEEDLELDLEVARAEEEVREADREAKKATLNRLLAERRLATKRKRRAQRH